MADKSVESSFFDVLSLALHFISRRPRAPFRLFYIATYKRLFLLCCFCMQSVSNPMGRGRAPWEGQEQGRGMGQGRLFRVVGWDGQTGTHLLLSVPGVEEDIPWEQHLQVTNDARRAC